MSETLSVTMSETLRTEKRFGGNEKYWYYKARRQRLCRCKFVLIVGVNIRVPEKVKHNAGMIVLNFYVELFLGLLHSFGTMAFLS